MGTPFDMIHDFKMAAGKTFFIEENMPMMATCMDHTNVIHLDYLIGWNQILFDTGVERKAEGARHIMEAMVFDWPIAVNTCMMAWAYERQGLYDFATQLYMK